ncbi:Metacaspase-1 [Lactarius tabidus]
MSRGHQSHRDQLHTLDTQPSSSYVGKRKALLIGVNYPDRSNGSINSEVFETAYFLHGLGFERNSMQVLTDDQPLNLPTKNNILAAMHWLVQGAQSGDSLFFYFSGPAAQINGGGPDGPDEAVMCAMDYVGDVQSLSSPANPWTITDNDVHDIMIKALPSNCRLTAILDACHSGTLLDLPFIYDSHGSLKPNKPGVVEQRSTGADVIYLSACKDYHLAYHDGRASEAFHGGALRRISQTFKECMTSLGYRVTYLDIIRRLCAGVHANGSRQQPQLSSSRPIDIDQRFII